MCQTTVHRRLTKLEKFLERRNSAGFIEIFITKAVGERRPPTSESGPESGNGWLSKFSGDVLVRRYIYDKIFM